VNPVGKFFASIRNSQVSFSRSLASMHVFSKIVRNFTIEGEKTMPVQSQEQETLNVKLVHFTKQNSPDDPVQLAFSVIDDQGREEIITGEIPYSYDLFRLCQENGWLNIRRGVSSIREGKAQRRVMTA
jgi:hypothetical protein